MKEEDKDIKSLSALLSRENLDGVEGRREQNQTSLFYRFSADGGLTWTEAHRADSGANETADYNFDVAVNGNEIYAIWSDAGKVYGDEILSMESSEAIAKAGKEMDLMLSVIEGSTGTVRETISIRTDGADMQPKVAAGDDGVVYVAWVTNDVSAKDGLISNGNQMGICYASSEDGYAVYSTPLAKGLYPLTADIGMLGPKMQIAVDVDTDADLNTQEDREIYTMDLGADGILSSMTSNDVVDSVPMFGRAGGENCLFWYQDGNIAYTSGENSISYVFGSENLPSMGQEFSLLESNHGDISIVWAATSLAQESGVDIYCTDFDEDTWSDVYRLGSLDSEFTGKVSGYRDLTGCRMAYLGRSYEDDALCSHISLYTPKERTDTSVVWYAGDGEPGEAYPLHMTVTNNGNKTVEKIFITSEDGGIQDEITGLSIPPGSSGEITWDGIILPEEMAEAYTAQLTVLAEGETDAGDNIVALSAGEPDLSVEAYYDLSSGEQLAGVQVTNHGIVPSDAILTVYKDEGHTEQLYQTKMQQLQGKESRMALLDLTVLAPEAHTFYFGVSDEGGMEAYVADNQAVLYIGKGTYLDYEASSGTGGGEEEPSTSYEYEQNKDMGTVTITKCTTSDTDVIIPPAIDGYTVTAIGDNAFENLTSMKTVSFPSTLESIGNYAFAGCTSLTGVTLPDSLTSLYKYVFMGCTSLKSAKLNDGRVNVTEGLFQGCTSLGSVAMPGSVRYIRENAFRGCASLKALGLPKSLSPVLNNAFLNSGIKSVRYAGTSADWRKITINQTGNISLLNAVVTGADGKNFSANKNNWNTVSKPGNPVKKPSVPKVKSFRAKAGKKKLTLTWKKLPGIAGYQIQVSTKKNFRGAGKISVSKSGKSYTRKKLKAKKKYYIRIRAFKTYRDGRGMTQKVYGKWNLISKKTR